MCPGAYSNKGNSDSYGSHLKSLSSDSQRRIDFCPERIYSKANHTRSRLARLCNCEDVLFTRILFCSPKMLLPLHLSVECKYGQYLVWPMRACISASERGNGVMEKSQMIKNTVYRAIRNYCTIAKRMVN